MTQIRQYLNMPDEKKSAANSLIKIFYDVRKIALNQVVNEYVETEFKIVNPANSWLVVLSKMIFKSSENKNPVSFYSRLLSRIKLLEKNDIAELSQICQRLENEVLINKENINKVNRCYIVMGLIYQYSDAPLQNIEKAILCFEKAARYENADSLNCLGCVYQNGIGVPVNLQKAVAFFQAAAAQGCAEAQNNLGFCYQNGIGIAKNNRNAVRLFESAAAQRCASALNNLGCLFKKDQNYYSAYDYFQQAAMCGEVSALCNLGELEQHSWRWQFRRPHLQKIIKYTKTAALCGDDCAIHNLGILYYQGGWIERDYQAAAVLFRYALIINDTEHRKQSLKTLHDATWFDPDIIVSYHVAMALNDKKLLKKIIASNPADINQLWLEDVSQDRFPLVFCAQAYQTMSEFVLNECYQDSPHLNGIYLSLGMKTLEEKSPDASVAFFEKIIPSSMLSPEDSFNAGLFLYSFVDMEMAFPFFQFAATRHFRDAEHFLANVFRSRLGEGLVERDVSCLEGLAEASSFTNHSIRMVRNMFFNRAINTNAPEMESNKVSNLIGEYVRVPS